jgi:ADP-ribose diphosphatase
MHPPDASSAVVLADIQQDVIVSAPELLARGYRPYERYHIAFALADGSEVEQTRDVVRTGRTVGVLPVDTRRGEIVLIRQFRLASHLATGKGNLVEIVAGFVEAHEQPADAARRECIEEIGVAPGMLVRLFSFMPAPGFSDEHATLFLAGVDASKVPAHAGAAVEGEHTQPFRVTIDAALAALAQGTMCNTYLLLALQWLALNRKRLDSLVG